jgi:hypothetical protein
VILLTKAGAEFQFLQPAQLEAVQDEHPEDISFVLPSADRETPLKQEKSLSTSLDWQSGHVIPFSDELPRISFSNSESHLWHLYSNIGIYSSLQIPQKIISDSLYECNSPPTF